MNFKKIAIPLLAAFIIVALSAPAFALPKPKIKSFPDLNNAIYFSTTEKWSSIGYSPTAMQFIKYIDQDGHYRYWMAISSLEIEFPLTQYATIKWGETEYQISQMDDRSFMYSRIHGSYFWKEQLGYYLLFEIPESVIQAIAAVPEQEEIKMVFTVAENSKMYEGVMKMGLRSSLTAMSLLSREDFDQYRSKKQKDYSEGKETPASF